MADPMAGAVLRALLPEQPPEFSVVEAGDPSFSVWQRFNNTWYPTKQSLGQPMYWAHLIAEFGSVNVIRWGTGQGQEVSRDGS